MTLSCFCETHNRSQVGPDRPSSTQKQAHGDSRKPRHPAMVQFQARSTKPRMMMGDQTLTSGFFFPNSQCLLFLIGQIHEMADRAAREECAAICDEQAIRLGWAADCARAIRETID